MSSGSDVEPPAPRRVEAVEPELPPGALPRDEDLSVQLEAALAERGAGYRARTRHVRGDGGPRFVNRLILESSPYLLQHAHNPVDWWPWGDAAFERATALGRPVLLSVGYATCHWCHVMEEESFEDLEIAHALNERYLCIKVDREERPDVDAVYMAAVQAFTGRGGWPMTVWLTADRRPFFAGTYFPPRDGSRGAARGFLSILTHLAQVHGQDRAGVDEQAEKFVAAVKRAVEGRPPGGLPGIEVLQQAAEQALESHDPLWGGFGGAPKFPRTGVQEQLLRYWRRTGDERARRAVETTLDRMARGGIHDHVGGGFHRYSTDERWLVPHFEKMLYDNAQLAVAFLEGWQATRREDFRRVCRRTIAYLLREMRAPEGTFFSATDADSEGAEGTFFVWTPEQIHAALDAEHARAFVAAYSIEAQGNFEGRCIPWQERSLAEVAADLGWTVERLTNLAEEACATLASVRARRPAPLLDDKRITAWNALVISALARGGLALNEPEWIAAAIAAAEFFLDRRREAGRLHRSYKGGHASGPAMLEDHAFLVAALLDLHEATQDGHWLHAAQTLQAHLDRDYADAAGGYFAVAHDGEQLIAREKPEHDGAVPSGNSIAIQCLLRLATLTGLAAYRERAERAIRASSVLAERLPAAVPNLLCAIDLMLDDPREIAIVTPENGPPAVVAARPFLDVLGQHYLPNRALVVVRDGAERDHAARSIPLLEGRSARKETSVAYVCVARTCDLPTSDVTVFAGQLAASNPQRVERPTSRG